MKKVIVRKFKEKEGGDITLVFPEDTATKGNIVAWRLIGQHHEISYSLYHQNTLPVSDEEAKKAFSDYCKEFYIGEEEMKSYKICKRISYAMLKKAWSY